MSTPGKGICARIRKTKKIKAVKNNFFLSCAEEAIFWKRAINLCTM